jgi:hypothetical protein
MLNNVKSQIILHGLTGLMHPYPGILNRVLNYYKINGGNKSWQKNINKQLLITWIEAWDEINSTSLCYFLPAFGYLCGNYQKKGLQETAAKLNPLTCH